MKSRRRVCIESSTRFRPIASAPRQTLWCKRLGRADPIGRRGASSRLRERGRGASDNRGEWNGLKHDEERIGWVRTADGCLLMSRPRREPFPLTRPYGASAFNLRNLSADADHHAARCNLAIPNGEDYFG